MKTNLEKLIDYANELGLSPAQRWMMTCLLMIAGQQATASASFLEIAQVYGSNGRNVQKLLRSMLKNDRLLRREKSRNEAGQAQPNRYSFPFLSGKLPAVPKLPALNDGLEAL